MCAWFKRKPTSICILCGHKMYGDHQPQMTKDGPLCIGCSQLAGAHTDADRARIRALTKSEVEALCNKGAQQEARNKRLESAGKRIFASRITGLSIPNTPCGTVTLEDDEHQIRFEVAGSSNVLLPTNRLLGCDTNEELVQVGSSGSPALMALVGGAILGEVGALAGIASTMKNYKYNVINTATIRYKTKAGKTDKIVLVIAKPFWDTRVDKVQPWQLQQNNPFHMFGYYCNQIVTAKLPKNIVL